MQHEWVNQRHVSSAAFERRGAASLAQQPGHELGLRCVCSVQASLGQPLPAAVFELAHDMSDRSFGKQGASTVWHGREE